MSRLKICGNHQAADIDVLLEHIDRIDCVGFIFTPKSKRVVQADQVAAWLRAYPELRAKAVGVFLDQDTAEVSAIVAKTGISVVQLHGHESVEYIRQLRQRLDQGVYNQSQTVSNISKEMDEHKIRDQNLVQVQIWKVLHIEASAQADVRNTIHQMQLYRHDVDSFMIDAKVKDQLGGTGQSFDWGVLADLHLALADKPVPIWVAGGIDAQNVAALLSHYPIYGIDVASGSETNGAKDRTKVNKLIEGVSKA